VQCAVAVSQLCTAIIVTVTAANSVLRACILF